MGGFLVDMHTESEHQRLNRLRAEHDVLRHKAEQDKRQLEELKVRV